MIGVVTVILSGQVVSNRLGISLTPINTNIGMDVIDIWLDGPSTEVWDVTAVAAAF